MRKPIMKGRFVDWRYELGKARQRAQMKVAWALPHWLVYWATIRLGAHATTGEHGDTVVPDLKFMEALKRWTPDA